jgi:hypothetical protein
LGGDQAVVRVTGGVAPLGERGLIAGLLQLQFENALLLALAFHVHPFRCQRRFDRNGLNGADDLAGDRRIDTLARKTHTTWQAKHLPGAITLIDRVRIAPPVGHLQTTSAASAGQEPNQRGSPTPTGLCAVRPAVGVDGKLLLVALVFRPIDVTFVMTLQKDLALVKGAVVAVSLAGAPVDDRGSVLTFAVGIGARVERVLQHRDHVAITDRRPVKRNHFLAI